MQAHSKTLPLDMFGRFLLTFLLFYSLSRTLWEAFSLTSLTAAGTNLLIIGTLLCALLCLSTGRRARIAVYIAMTTVLALAAIVAYRYISDGWSVVFNRVFSQFELRYGRIFPYFRSGLSSGAPNLCAAMFLIYPTAVLAVCAERSVRLRSVWRFVFPVSAVLLWVGAAIFRLPVSGVTPVLFALALLGMRARSVMLGATASDKGLAIIPILITLALTLVLFSTPFALIAADRKSAAINLRRKIAENVHKLRYHAADPVMPEGDFSGLNAFTPEDAAALYVTTTEPKPMYLRGFVGDVYTGDGWKRMEPQELGPYATAFSWMHTGNFYGQTQYASLVDTLGIESNVNSIYIENVSACSAYEFIPYALKRSLTGSPDKNAIGDMYINSKGRAYEMRVLSYDIDQYAVLYDTLVKADHANVPEVYEYLKYEGAYRDFVYGEYLYVPAAARASVLKLPEVQDVPNGVRVPFADACGIVLNCLVNLCEYNENPGQTPDGWDFCAWFLDESNTGYAPHYASAATLIFRELGIPARYVEGYAIREEDVALAVDGRIEVPQANAHAWVEIYRDGVGFIPFEVTPPFVTDIPVSSPKQSGGSGSSSSNAVTQDMPEQEPELTKAQMLLILIAVLLAVVLTGLAYLYIRRLVIKKRRDRLLLNADNAEAVCWLTAYAVMLLGHIGITRGNGSLLNMIPETEGLFGKAFADAYANVVGIQREAMFGGKAVSDDSRTAARDFVDSVLKNLKQACGLRKRLKLKWILCVY